MCDVSDDDLSGFAPLNKKKKRAGVNNLNKADKTDGAKSRRLNKKSEKKNGKKQTKDVGKFKQTTNNYGAGNSNKCNLNSNVDEGNDGQVQEERCPICQMPLSLLRIQSPEWHVTECLSVSFTSLKDCPAGTKCDNTIVSHYTKFKHAEFASQSTSNTSEEPVIQDGGSDFKTEIVGCFAGTSKDGPQDIKSDLANHLHEQYDEANESDDDIFSEAKSVNDGLVEGKNCTRSVDVIDVNYEHREEENSNDDKDDLGSSLKCEGKDFDLFDDDDDLLAAAGSDGDDDDDDDVEGENESLADEHDEEGTAKEDEKVSDNGEGDLTILSSICADADTTCDFSQIPHPTSGAAMTLEYSQSSPSKFSSVRSTPENSESSNSKGNSGRSQSSILSFFGSRNHVSNKSASGGPDISQNNTTHERTSQKKGPTNPLAAERFMKQFSQTGTSSKEPSNSTAITLTGKSLTTEKTKEAETGRPSYKRSCPFYKKIPGTSFTVDAFCYGSVPGCSSYFLSHFHYDHYRGLDKRFMHPVYCSQVTANLVKKKINVNPCFIHALAMNKPTQIDGVKVILLEANHCPGSVLFLFTLPDGSNVLHTGDFRADPSMELYPELQDVSIKQLYLDTTYCDSAYAFPPQIDVIKATIEVTRKHLYYNPNTLIAVGAYTIGKERIFLALAEEFNFQVCVTREKQRILECQDNPIINKRMTTIAQGARLHVLPMKMLNFKDLTAYLEKVKGFYDNLLAFEPTGWTHSRGASSNILKLEPKLNRGNIAIYGVPYSEHSSFLELKRFVQWCRPQKIIPTVNVGSPSSRAKMDSHFRTWLSENPSPQSKQANLASFFWKNIN